MSPVSSIGNDGVLCEILTSLRRLSNKGHRTLLCFDDAHLLSEEALLHVVQPLLNLAESEEHAMLAMLLVGQPVLSAKIRKLHQISERIAVTTAAHWFHRDRNGGLRSQQSAPVRWSCGDLLWGRSAAIV